MLQCSRQYQGVSSKRSVGDRAGVDTIFSLRRKKAVGLVRRLTLGGGRETEPYGYRNEVNTPCGQLPMSKPWSTLSQLRTGVRVWSGPLLRGCGCGVPCPMLLGWWIITRSIGRYFGTELLSKMVGVATYKYRARTGKAR